MYAWILPIIIAIIFIIIFMFRKPERITDDANKFKVYVFDSKKPGPTVLIVSGVHGNERAGPIYLTQLINTGYFRPNKGKLIIAPIVNKWGFDNNTRYKRGIINTDINRNFTEYGGKDSYSNEMIELAKEANIILDFHEGWGYHLKDSNSVGSTLSPTKELMSDANKIANDINNTIAIPYKKFIVRDRDSCDLTGTFACYCDMNNKAYMLIETSGQNDIEPLEVRANQIKIIIDNIVNKYLM